MIKIVEFNSTFAGWLSFKETGECKSEIIGRILETLVDEKTDYVLNNGDTVICGIRSYDTLESIKNTIRS